MGKKQKNINRILLALVFVFAAGALFSAMSLLKGARDAGREAELAAEVSAMLEALPEAALDAPMPSASAAVDASLSDKPEATPRPSAAPLPEPTPSPSPEKPQMLGWAQKLTAKYPDLVGWITVGDEISLPVVQGEDNDYYLNHAIDGSENRYGTVFLDYQNRPYSLTGNNYIYGHHYQYDDTMFAPLEKYNDEAYALEYKTFTYSSLYHVYECRIFSAYLIYPDDWRIYAVKFSDKADYQAWLDERLALSRYDFGVTPASADRVMSLSTCDYNFDYARLIIHAVMTQTK